VLDPQARIAARALELTARFGCAGTQRDHLAELGSRAAVLRSPREQRQDSARTLEARALGLERLSFRRQALRLGIGLVDRSLLLREDLGMDRGLAHCAARVVEREERLVQALVLAARPIDRIGFLTQRLHHRVRADPSRPRTEQALAQLARAAEELVCTLFERVVAEREQRAKLRLRDPGGDPGDVRALERHTVVIRERRLAALATDHVELAAVRVAQQRADA
jgi:hypothetical protein